MVGAFIILCTVNIPLTLITFAVLLFWGLYNISAVTKVLGKLLDLLSPLLLGICIAFVLNLMMRRWNDCGTVRWPNGTVGGTGS